MKNIIKRILVGVAVGTILMLIRSNVFAANLNMVPTSCGTATNSTFNNGTVSGNTSSVNISSVMYYCNPSGSNNWKYLRFSYTLGSGLTSSVGTMSFYVVGADVSNVNIRTGGTDYTCYLNTGVDINNTSEKLFSVTCSNIPYSSSRQYYIYIYKTNSSLSQVYITTNYVYIPDVDIAGAISNQSTQQHQDAQQAHQDAQAINDSINSSTTPSGSDTNNAYSNFEGATAQNGVITSLVTLPVSLFTNILSALNSSCTRFDMGTLLGTHLYFNCINPASYLGSQLWGVIDILMSGFFVWYISRKLIKVFENLSSLKEGDPVGD